jgi:hypothetical protein
VASVPAAIVDIGVGGARIRADVIAPPAATVVVATTLPGSNAPLYIEGRVAWTRTGEMGISFRSRDPAGASRIREAIRRLLRDAVPQ